MKIELTKVVKKYDEIFCLGPIDLVFEPGTSTGLIGPNGAGKTTLMEIICGVKNATSGKITFNGSTNSNLTKQEVCLIPTVASIPDYLTGIELIHYTLALNGINSKDFEIEINEKLQNFHLDKHCHKIVKDYSFGMKRKVLLIALLSLNPKAIILDEPFNGLDFESVEYLRQLLIELKNKQHTILVSSHIREIIDSLCDRKIMLKNGMIE